MVKSPPPQNADTRTHNRSQFRGIRKREWGKWVSEVRLPNSRERIWLGSYDTPEQAARAYDAAAYCLRGRKANLNFSDTPPEIPSASLLSREQIKAAAAKFALESPSPAAALQSSITLSESGFPTIDSQQIPLDEEESAFWESLLADSDDNYCSNLDNFPSMTPTASRLETEEGVLFEEDGLSNFGEAARGTRLDDVRSGWSLCQGPNGGY